MSLSRAKAWLKAKSKSRPFQWIISVGQGISLGSSLHDGLTKLLTISTISGLAARILGNINWGTAAMVGIILTYMTKNAIGTNIKNMDEQGERVQEHEEKLEADEKKFLNQQLSDIKLLEILIKMNSDKPAIIFELNQLLEDKINSYNPFGNQGHRQNSEARSSNPLNRPGFYHTNPSHASNSHYIDDSYHEMVEVEPSHISPSHRLLSTAYSNSGLFLFHPVSTSSTRYTPNSSVVIEVYDNEDQEVSDNHVIPPRAMGSTNA